MNEWRSVTTEDSEEIKREGRGTHLSQGTRSIGRVRDLSQDGEFSMRARRWTLAGAAGWAVIAALTRSGMVRIGMIELLFLFGPLVIVPLGMELARMRRTARSDFARKLESLTQILQPLGAVMAIEAMCLGPGWRAGIFASGWLLVCGIATLSGALELGESFAGKSARATLVEIAFAIAKIDLAVGGGWFVASRWGLHPLGIQEPIGLLTAVHFHFAGFATATIAAATLHFVERGGEALWLRRVIWLVALLPFAVAAGFVISPVLKMSAAVLFSCSVVLLAWFLWKHAGAVKDRAARMYLRIASGSIFFGMILSSAYAVADFSGSEILPIPRMASTHGVINAVGFCLCGLLGWIVESESQR